jgi:uncharacterized protein
MSGVSGAGVARSPSDYAQLSRNIVVFGRALRANGFRAQPDRMILLADALRAVGLHSRTDVKAAACTVLVRTAEERRRFGVAFDAFWTAHAARRDPQPSPKEHDAEKAESKPGERPIAGRSPRPLPVPLGADSHPPSDTSHDSSPVRAVQSPLDGDRSYTYSFAEGLYQKDFARFDDSELERARELTKRKTWELGIRLSRRTASGERGGVFDATRTLRSSLRRGGELTTLMTKVRREKRRDLVLICDISGSMDRYSRLLLQFVHTVRHAVGNVEAFVFGTRLTRITRQLRHRAIHEACADVAANVADWAGGTRIGECLRDFNRRFARRVLSRGAIVVIVSDGWDRGDVEMLSAEMQRLQRSAYRLIWLNPLLGSAGYRPQTVGMRAALPFVDNFLPAHNLRSLMQLAELLQSVEHRRPARVQRHV